MAAAAAAAVAVPASAHHLAVTVAITAWTAAAAAATAAQATTVPTMPTTMPTTAVPPILAVATVPPTSAAQVRATASGKLVARVEAYAACVSGVSGGCALPGKAERLLCRNLEGDEVALLWFMWMDERKGLAASEHKCAEAAFKRLCMEMRAIATTTSPFERVLHAKFYYDLCTIMRTRVAQSSRLQLPAYCIECEAWKRKNGDDRDGACDHTEKYHSPSNPARSLGHHLADCTCLMAA
jgi:hypothetical protein